MSEPAQKPGKSRQDFGTPRAFLDAVQLRFGRITLDLAAHERNHVCDRWFGPGGECVDSLQETWPESGVLWLNPEFADIEPWARKCAAHITPNRRQLGSLEEHLDEITGESLWRAARKFVILLLVPASIGSNWFACHVNGKAIVEGVQGRLSFDGKAPYPKDCMLCQFWPDGRHGFGVWDWRKESSRVRA
jgi:DNA N-6-adenine-methyltransferase (Dam)